MWAMWTFVHKILTKLHEVGPLQCYSSKPVFDREFMEDLIIWWPKVTTQHLFNFLELSNLCCE